jgi:hypothetical protein
MVGASKFTSGTTSTLGPAREAANRTWAGRGSGARCDLCRGIISEDQIEYEVELADARNRVLTLHLDCYEQWAISRDTLEALRDSI